MTEPTPTTEIYPLQHGIPNRVPLRHIPLIMSLSRNGTATPGAGSRVTVPLPGRDVSNVIIRDSIPKDLALNPLSITAPAGFTQTITGNIVTWTKAVMQVNDSGQITFTATASNSCPLPSKTIFNHTWISGLNESAAHDSSKVILTCDSAIKLTPSYLTLFDPTGKTIHSGDTAHIDSTAFTIQVIDPPECQ